MTKWLEIWIKMTCDYEVDLESLFEIELDSRMRLLISHHHETFFYFLSIDDLLNLSSYGEVNPTHAYYNDSRTSKDNEDPSCSTRFKTRRTQKTSSALEALLKTLYALLLYLLGILVYHANQFVPRPVQLNTGRENVNSVRPNVNTGRANVNTGSFNINTVKAKQLVPTSNSNSFSHVRPQDHPLKNIKDRGIFDSGCSGHMTGNKDHLDDFEECKGGSVTFGGSKGYITGAVTQPSPSEPLPSSSPPPVISATTESEPTPVAESTTHPNSLSPEPDNEPIEHTFEQPSSEHQPLSPRQETEIPQSQDPTHPHVAEERTMTVDDLLQLVPTLITKVDSLKKELKQTKLTMGKVIVKLVKKVKKMEAVLKRRHVVLTDSEDEDAKNSSKQGRNLQEESLDEMVRSIMKDKSEVFETPIQGKTLGEADISPEGLEAAKTLAKVLTQRTKTYTRKVKTGLRRKLDADEVGTSEEINTGFTYVSIAFTDVNTAFEEINSGDESIIPSPKKVRLQAQEEDENARKAELQRQHALIAKRVQDELELSETQKNRMAQVQQAAKYYTEE
ncbi:hypothetical protein Tco_0908341 [Tanacetum coccineum]|uniref:Retrovirus-related Pol polyprotein from transposon TNT 1-94-like beta-barrel domain-containing protein n=1 Tax=Tanacetum coccineum TaxID=301880 RepID=A0ABQ5CQC0_9ASTR